MLTGEHDGQLAVAHERKRLEQAAVVLVRPQVRGVDHEALRQLELPEELRVGRSGPEQRAVDGQGLTSTRAGSIPWRSTIVSLLYSLIVTSARAARIAPVYTTAR